MHQQPSSSNDLQKILDYNANSIFKYYLWRPWKLLGRSLVILWFLGGFVFHLIIDKLTGQSQNNTLKRAIELKMTITRLGPTFIKVGQALSTRPDLVEKSYLDELVKLQDQLPPFSNQIAREIIESELGKSLEDVYKEISLDPVAAASLGQVYKGKLHSGQEVAIKVQRPKLKNIISLDLCWMRLVADWFGKLLPLNLGHNLTLIVDEFGEKLFEEINYLNEADNGEKFALNFADDPDVKVPKIYREYSGRYVLTLEWINGIKLTNINDIKKAGIDPQNMIKIGVISGLRQLLEHGFFHADPHPGNLFATFDGRMAYIDFGMMDQLEERTKETLVSSVVQLINQDYPALADDFVRLGFLSNDTDIRPIIPALEKVFGKAIGQKVKDFNFKTITDDFSGLVYEYPFRIPAKFALIIRSLVTQEGLALTLDPNFKIVEVSYPYIAKRLLQGESPELRRRLLEVLFKDGKFQWQRLENMITIARSENNFNLLPTAQLSLQYVLSEEGRALRKQLVLALLEDDKLHTEEVKRLWSLIKDDLQPDRIWSVAWSALRDFSSQGVAAIIPTASSLR
jgi:predicted unusual protein kinase regulating ubiquinone biosynthesis (AarF/ABC1/UbiB family)